MKIDLSNYEIVCKILFGNNLKIIFRNIIDSTDTKVLDLNEVAGFIDTTSEGKAIQILRLDEPGGSFNVELVMRLKRGEITSFPEVYLFTDQTCVHFCFRAVARTIEFRDRNEKDEGIA